MEKAYQLTEILGKKSTSSKPKIPTEDEVCEDLAFISDQVKKSKTKGKAVQNAITLDYVYMDAIGAAQEQFPNLLNNRMFKKRRLLPIDKLQNEINNIAKSQ